MPLGGLFDIFAYFWHGKTKCNIVFLWEELAAKIEAAAKDLEGAQIPK